MDLSKNLIVRLVTEVENGGHLLVPADPIMILILDSFSQINLEIHQIHTKEDLMGHRI